MDDPGVFDYSTVSTIKAVKFNILGNDDIVNMSALGPGPGLTSIDLFRNGEPNEGGPNDPRLGTTSADTYCPTCGYIMLYCPGHFGHITLAEAVLHVKYISYVHKILNMICISCSKILVYRNETEIQKVLNIKSNKERANFIKETTKNITHCSKANYGCGCPVPKIKIESNKKSALNIIAETESSSPDDHTNEKKKLRQILSPNMIYDILKNITDDDCILMGIDASVSRPENMIHTIFPVPPNSIRPSAKGDYSGGMSMEDDLTHQIAAIMKAHLRIQKNKESLNENSSHFSSDYHQLLEFQCATYMENDSVAALKSEQKGKPTKSLSERLKGKQGHFRGNLMGKRLDFTGRSVITSDPTIDNDELGVPVEIAMNLTRPITVNPSNIEELTKKVRNGRDTYPGANYLFPVSKMVQGRQVQPIDLRFKNDIELHYGDVVEVHLVDGNIVLLNRQPTLHKQSMMAHRVKVINDRSFKTFRLSVAIVTPYNADKLHCPKAINLNLYSRNSNQVFTGVSSKYYIYIVPKINTMASRNFNKIMLKRCSAIHNCFGEIRENGQCVTEHKDRR
jgi:DNA-directed RNA polymerase II subunit RPB1